MGLELKISKELAVLNATLDEWSRMADVITQVMPKGQANSLLNQMFQTLPACYQVIVEAFQPLLKINSQGTFSREFEAQQQGYQQDFLALASQPRHHAEAAHEYYIQASTYKALKTSYPILRRSFDNLYEFIDKWVTNDAWILMGSDVIFKTLNRLLLDIHHLKRQDEEEAWLIFDAAMSRFGRQISLLEQKLAHMAFASCDLVEV